MLFRAIPLGSLRRMSPEVGDIDIAVSTSDRKEAIKYILQFEKIDNITDEGETKVLLLSKTECR